MKFCILHVPFARFFCITLLLCFASLLGSCDTGDETTETPTANEVLELLENYRDQVKPKLDPVVVSEVETYAAGFPLETPDGIEPVTITASENESLDVTPTINRRDWAFAERGIGYTFTGGLQQGQQQQLDTGFWCFIEAALLKTDEAEHLANVGFHLNNRGKWKDAEKVLLYALSLDSTSATALNNLAFTHASQGNFTTAATFQLQATHLWPGEQSLVKQLANYYNLAGAGDAANALNEALGTSSGTPSSSYELPDNLSPRALDMVETLDELSSDMGQELNDLEIKYEKDEEVASTTYYSSLDILSQNYGFCIFDMIEQYPGNVPEFVYIQCINCDIPNIHATFHVQFEMYQTMAIIWSGFEEEATGLLQYSLNTAQENITQAKLSTSERYALELYAHNRLFADNANQIWGRVADIKRSWQEDLLSYRKTIQDGCGEAPVGELSHVKERDIACEMFPFFCKKWAIWFGIGSFSWDPNGLCELTLGQGVQAKLGYNFGTDSVSIGAGYGFNVAGISAGASVRFTTKKGLEGVVEIEPAVPILIVSKQSMPSIKFGSFFN